MSIEGVISLPFSETEIESMVREAVEKIFETMLSSEATYKNSVCFTVEKGAEKKPPVPVPLPDEPIIAAAVGFIGTVNGVIYLYFVESMANEIAQTFLGLDADELEEEGAEVINDVLGEMANMTVGTFKNQMCDRGFNCRLTIPSILRGQHFSIETTTSVLRNIYCFEGLGNTFAIDLLMKPGE